MPDALPRRPHPFAWTLLAAVLLAGGAAALAPARAPAVALYVLAVAGWMAFNGQAFRRIELPGGAALERDATELDGAAAGFGEFRDTIALRLEEIDGAIEDLIERVDGLETRSQEGDPGVP